MPEPTHIDEELLLFGLTQCDDRFLDALLHMARLCLDDPSPRSNRILKVASDAVGGYTALARLIFDRKA